MLCTSNKTSVLCLFLYRDMFASVLTPAFERALQNMLQNLGQTFTKGAKDYDAVVRKEVHALTQSVKDAVRNLEKSRGNQTGEMERALSNFQETILQEIRENARAQRRLVGSGQKCVKRDPTQIWCD